MSKVIVRGLLLVGVFVGLAGLPGCGGSPITITLSCSGCTGSPATAVTINQNSTVAVTANVANDKTNSGVSWSIGTSPGSLSSQTTTSVTYVAPAALTATSTATLTATSIANTNVSESLTITIDAIFQFQSTSLPIATQGLAYAGTISTVGAAGPFTWAIVSGSLPAGLTLSSSDTASAEVSGTPTATGTSSVTVQVTDGAGNFIKETFTIIVNPPPGLTITTPATLSPGTLDVDYSYVLQAAYGKPPYTWTIVSGSLPPGLTLNSGGTISGVPTEVITSTFNVQVKDSATPNPAVYPPNGLGFSMTISISEPLVNADLSGNYAFLVGGFDASGKSFMAAGSFVASGGAINGIMDTNDGASVPTVQTEIAFGGTYSIGANGLGVMSFVPTGRTFALSFVPTSNGAIIQNANLIEFDNTGDQASGVLLQQTTGDFSSALTAGNFAFGFLGSDPTGLRYGLAGAFTVSGAGVLDSDDGGTLLTDTAFTSVINSANPSSGRGTMAFSVSGTAANYAYYVVNNQQALVIEIDQAGIVSGNILQQQSGAFGASTLTDGVFETTAVPSAGTALSQLGVLTTDGSSTLGTSFNNNTSPTGAIQTSSGTYSVASTTGRTTLTGTGLASSDPVLYLVEPNQGFLVGTDAAVTSGFMKAQSSPLTLSGTYAGGTIAPTSSGPSGEVAAAVANGSGVLSLSYNASTSAGLLENQAEILSYSSPSTNGRGTIPQSGNPTSIFYVLSSDEFWTLSVNPSGTIQIFPPTCNPTCGTE